MQQQQQLKEEAYVPTIVRRFKEPRVLSVLDRRCVVGACPRLVGADPLGMATEPSDDDSYIVLSLSTTRMCICMLRGLQNCVCQ